MKFAAALSSDHIEQGGDAHVQRLAPPIPLIAARGGALKEINLPSPHLHQFGLMAH